MEEQILQLDGKSIYYRHSGEGYPVVLLHGIPTHSGLWDGVMPILEKSCSVYAFDLPGYGKSAGYDSRDLNIRSQARLLYKALEKLDLKKPVIAGHDMGGGIAQIMALSRPGELSGMVLLDSVCYDSWPINLLCAESKVSVLLKNLPPEVALDVFTSYMADGLYDKSLAGKLAEKYWKYFSSPGGEKKFLKIVESLDS
jgi:pimeloyl-ACP methyl ester carboxylesterase